MNYKQFRIRLGLNSQESRRGGKPSVGTGKGEEVPASMEPDPPDAPRKWGRKSRTRTNDHDQE
jgi:hypothetical protein